MLLFLLLFLSLFLFNKCDISLFKPPFVSVIMQISSKWEMPSILFYSVYDNVQPYVCHEIFDH